MWHWLFIAPWLVFGAWWLVRSLGTARTETRESHLSRLDARHLPRRRRHPVGGSDRAAAAPAVAFVAGAGLRRPRARARRHRLRHLGARAPRQAVERHRHASARGASHRAVGPLSAGASPHLHGPPDRGHRRGVGARRPRGRPRRRALRPRNRAQDRDRREAPRRAIRRQNTPLIATKVRAIIPFIL